MDTQLFTITQYCSMHQVEASFVEQLQSEGLIEIVVQSEERFIDENQLHRLELFTRLHTELGINPEGMDVIANLLDKISALQNELHQARGRLRSFENSP